MNERTIRKIIRLDNDFYRANHESFSKSRQSPWPGWDRVAQEVSALEGPLSILDVASGNGRFETFLTERLNGRDMAFTCVDSSVELMGEGVVSGFELDVIAALADGSGLSFPDGAFDCAVSFGFMHHVPSAVLRRAFMWELVRTVRHGGLAALSFWRFMDDEGLARKALRSTADGCAAVGIDETELEDGDYLLGWDGSDKTLRYCHHFDDGEIDALACDLVDTAEVVARYESDGRNAALNSYLVLRRR